MPGQDVGQLRAHKPLANSVDVDIYVPDKLRVRERLTAANEGDEARNSALSSAKANLREFTTSQRQLFPLFIVHLLCVSINYEASMDGAKHL